MTILDFLKKLESNDIFENEVFDVNDQTLNVNQLTSEWNTFINCTFNCEKLGFDSIQNKNLILVFKNCNFNCKLEFDTCTFSELRFFSCKINSSTVGILNSNIDYLSFTENIKDIRNVKPNYVKNATIEINGGYINSINIENISLVSTKK